MTRARGQSARRRYTSFDNEHSTSKKSPRQTKRLRTKSSTATLDTTSKRSKYFHHEAAPSSDNIDSHDDGSNFEDAGGPDSSSPGVSPEFDSDDDDVSIDPTMRHSGVQKTHSQAATKGKELWRSGVKSTLGPGQEVFIKLPRARDAGDICYQDETLHPNTFLFLGDLKQNNDREWLKIHDADFRQSQKDFNNFIEKLTDRLLEKDDKLPELPIKDIGSIVTFGSVKILRPIKPIFPPLGLGLAGKVHTQLTDVQVAPGASFVGGGLWHPESQPLNLLRRAVDTKSHELKNIIMDSRLRRVFMGGVRNDEGEVMQSFVNHNSSNALKRKPKGYQEDNPNIDLLRLKNFTIGRSLSDEDLLRDNALDTIVDMFGILTPFVTYLNSIVMPDTGTESDPDRDSDDDDDDDD